MQEVTVVGGMAEGFHSSPPLLLLFLEGPRLSQLHCRPAGLLCWRMQAQLRPQLLKLGPSFPSDTNADLVGGFQEHLEIPTWTF